MGDGSPNGRVGGWPPERELAKKTTTHQLQNIRHKLDQGCIEFFFLPLSSQDKKISSVCVCVMSTYLVSGVGSW